MFKNGRDIDVGGVGLMKKKKEKKKNLNNNNNNNNNKKIQKVISRESLDFVQDSKKCKPFWTHAINLPGPELAASLPLR